LTSHFKQGWLWLMLIFGIGILILSALSACGTGGNPGTAATPSLLEITPSPTAPPTFDWVAFDTAVATVMLGIPTGTPDLHYPPGKNADKQLNDTYYKARETVIAQNPPPLPPLTPPTPPVTPWGYATPHLAGVGTIDNGCGRPFYHNITRGNSWYEQGVGEDTMVCAGVTLPPPGVAAVLVVVYDANGPGILSGPDIYQVPAAVQEVRVIDAVGERLTLRADDGTLFYFDVPTRQWVPPAPSPVPSLPPTP